MLISLRAVTPRRTRTTAPRPAHPPTTATGSSALGRRDVARQLAQELALGRLVRLVTGGDLEALEPLGAYHRAAERVGRIERRPRVRASAGTSGAGDETEHPAAMAAMACATRSTTGTTGSFASEENGHLAVSPENALAEVLHYAAADAAEEI